MTLSFELLSFVLGVLGILFSVFAIWQTNDTKKQSDDVHRTTAAMLSEIRTEAGSISVLVREEMQKYNDIGRQLMTNRISNNISSGPPKIVIEADSPSESIK